LNGLVAATAPLSIDYNEGETGVSNQVHITVNGETREIPRGLSVSGVLDLLGVKPDRVAVELNCSIVRREEWSRTQIEDGAQLEVVQFVGGG
jgi:sulfur carrier protein